MSHTFTNYHTRDLDLDLEGLALRMTIVTNFDELMEQLIAKGDDHEDVRDERLPYWADLWPSAVALGRYLVHSGLIQPGLSVTEIGCGLALPGIMAGRLGAEVTLSDYLPEALDFARHNWSQNMDRPARFVRMDWRKPDPALAADLVLASDIAYERRFFEHLPAAFRILCKPGGTILVSEPGREVAKEFFEQLPEAGFRVEKAVMEGAFNGINYKVNIYQLSLPVPIV